MQNFPDPLQPLAQVVLLGFEGKIEVGKVFLEVGDGFGRIVAFGGKDGYGDGFFYLEAGVVQGLQLEGGGKLGG